MMYSMVMGEAPFDAASKDKIKDQVLNKPISFAKLKRRIAARKNKCGQPPQKKASMTSKVTARANEMLIAEDKHARV